MEGHFLAPRVAALFADLAPQEGGDIFFEVINGTSASWVPTTICFFERKKHIEELSRIGHHRAQDSLDGSWGSQYTTPQNQIMDAILPIDGVTCMFRCLGAKFSQVLIYSMKMYEIEVAHWHKSWPIVLSLRKGNTFLRYLISGI